MEITAILIMAVLVEAVVTYIKTWVVDKQLKWPMLLSTVLSVAVCLAYGLDIPSAVGVSSGVPFVGTVITGVLIARGRNYINDLLKKLTSGGVIVPFEETDVEI